MKRTANQSNVSNLTTAPQKQISGRFSLAAALLCGLTASASNARVAAEKGFTIAPEVQNPILLKTQPDAACDLHPAGDTSRTMRFYANGEGYVKINASARKGIEGRFELDCSSKGRGATYPLHLLAGSTPTAEMPAPLGHVPAPKGSMVRPALTEAEAQSLSDDELSRLGYPERPDVQSSPDKYAKWLERVSRPMTVLPTHLVSRSDIRSGPASYSSSNWSGLEAHSTTKHNYSAVSGTWDVPPIAGASADGNIDYSAYWVGLDGDGTKDLVQAGTEQDAQEFLGIVFTDYYAWSELLPNQPTEQEVFAVNAGDEIDVEVWIGTGSGAPNPNGKFGSFRITDVTQSQEARFDTPLNGTKYNGTEAEWIMERPQVGGSLPELAAYLITNMVNADALKVSTNKWVPVGTAANRDITMYNGADKLSEAVWTGKGSNLITFLWLDYH